MLSIKSTRLSASPVATAVLASASPFISQSTRALSSPDYNYQQVLLAIVFGVLATVLGLIGLVNGYLQLRRYSMPRPDIETLSHQRTESMILGDVRYAAHSTLLFGYVN